MTKEKRITLNADKRKTISNVFQSHWEREESPVMQKYNQAKENYNTIRADMKILVEQIVRKYQPEEDVETVRAMRSKYGDSGGDLHHDNCFNFKYEYEEVDSDGKAHITYDDTNLNFGLQRGSYRNSEFGLAYYRNELKEKGYDPDYKSRWKMERRNPRYYECESECEKWLGFSNSSNEDKGQAIKPVAEWEKDFKLWVIGTSYCHSRQFKVDETTFKVLKQFTIAQDKLIEAHENIFSYTEEKMKKLRLGLKSYRYFDQAKALADKLGVVLNESMMNESSSLALSVYSPENLASLLEDTVKNDNADIIAQFKAQRSMAN